MLPLSRFRALTFDCYGTLIDWETGLRRILRDLGMIREGNDEAVLEAFVLAEADAESSVRSYSPYKDVLRAVQASLARRFGATIDPTRPDALSHSIADWPAFADTSSVLTRLKRHFKLVIVSNIDRDLFASSLPKLGVQFDAVITAEDVRSYKPAPDHFRRALDVLGMPANDVLHVAQSLYHDINPARELGFTTVWVNRRIGKAGHGATAPSSAEPHLTVPDLRTLADLALSDV